MNLCIYKHEWYYIIFIAIPSVKVVQKFYKIRHGNNVTIDCNITSTPNYINVYWLKTFNDLTTKVTSHTHRVHGGSVTVPSLTILNIDMNDSGLYTCYAQNLVGTGSSEHANLTVVGSKCFAFILFHSAEYWKKHYIFKQWITSKYICFSCQFAVFLVYITVLLATHTREHNRMN